MSKTPRFGLLALSCVLLIAALGVGRAGAQEAPRQWLFVLQGTLTSISDTTMSLRPDPRIVAFTDRPNRIARVIGLAALVADFSEGGGDGFRNDPPNASLVSEADGKSASWSWPSLQGDRARGGQVRGDRARGGPGARRRAR
jgi:hypothetical protein